MNNKLSMSMIFENRKINNDISIQETTPSIWIPSRNIRKCYTCSNEFSFWKRKHHCRICGRVFCSSCSGRWGSIPSLISVMSPVEKNISIYSLLSSQKRMCDNCSHKTTFIKNSKDSIHILINLPIPFKQLYTLRLVNKEWCKSINTILSFYKGIHYKLPCEPVTKLERKLLWNHRKEFSQHFFLTSKCLSIFDGGEKYTQLKNLINYFNKKRKTNNCIELSCRRNCSSRPKIEEILEICNNIYVIKSKICRSWLLSLFNTIDDEEIKIIIPWLINIGLKHYSFFYDVIIPLCCTNINIAFSFFLECKFFMQDKIIYFKLNKVFNLFLRKIGTLTATQFYKSYNFVKLINENIFYEISPSVWENQVASWIELNGYPSLPWAFHDKVTGVDSAGIKKFNSATKPWKVPLIVKTKNGEKIVNILVKFEDVRKDKLTMVVAHFLKDICQDYIDVTTYNVFPLDETCGWIQMVEKCSTLYDIKHKYKTTLQNYIMDFNPNITIKEMRERFIKTCVSSCVLCYILGVGDRHLENILVTSQGKLLHIDFSYILGDDPKNLKVEMKITEDMVRMMGGLTSETYKKFQKKCTYVYNKIRMRSSLWYFLLSYLYFSVPIIDINNYTEVRIKNHIIERLLPGENDKEASTQIIDIVDRSSKTSWSQNLAEFSHKIGNTLREATQFNIEL
jgi:hypothetical protein